MKRVKRESEKGDRPGRTYFIKFSISLIRAGIFGCVKLIPGAGIRLCLIPG